MACLCAVLHVAKWGHCIDLFVCAIVRNSCGRGRPVSVSQAKSYPSMKPLGAWVNELMDRLAFFQSWIDNGPPAVREHTAKSHMRACMSHYTPSK